MDTPIYTLDTPQLRLLALDAATMRLLLSNPQAVERKLGVERTQRTLTDALRTTIRVNIRRMEANPETAIWSSNWQVVLQDENRIIGSVGFKGKPNAKGEVEIGYGLDEAYRSQGYATEAVTALVEWALAQPGVQAVTAETHPTNVPSMRVLQKVGMVLERTANNYLYWRTSTPPHRRLAQQEQPPASGQFTLYDLVVVVESIQGHCTCTMSVGDCFYLHSGKLSLPEGGDFCLYALQSVIPLLPAKQRPNHPADWMETDSQVVCPDPACQLTMRIDRVGRRALHHDDVSSLPWNSVQQDAQ